VFLELELELIGIGKRIERGENKERKRIERVGIGIN